jgi:peroxiredoxin
MNRPLLLVLALATLSGAAVYAYVRSGGRLRPSATPAFTEPEKHLVTPSMRAATDAMTARPAPPFHTRATDGTTYDLADLTREAPLVLLFIKDGCPCSVDAQRFFNRLHAAYGHEIRFLGAIDADDTRARAWGRENRTTFPLLVDPESSIAHAYGAESSAYAAIITKEGTIDRLYPGYSVAMLAELNERLARLAGVPPWPIDASGAPEELSTGCPFAD